jgi:predicted anti-sigma-YlaC factor YlaD
MDNLALYVLIGFLVMFTGLNAIVTYIVCKTHFVVENRKRNQLIFIWLVPIIGALLAIILNREDYFAQKQRDKVGNNPNITESQAVNYGRAANHRGGR